MASDGVIAETAFIHVMAEVRNSVVGADSRIWQFASVVRNAFIGENCSVASCAIVDGAEVGDGTIISHGAFIDPGIKIGANVFIGPHVSLCNDAWPRADKTGFDMGALISGEFVTTVVHDGASLGAGVIVLPGIVIGRNSMVAAGSVVERDVPDDCLHKRSGEIVPLDKSRQPRRMRRAA